ATLWRALRGWRRNRRRRRNVPASGMLQPVSRKALTAACLAAGLIAAACAAVAPAATLSGTRWTAAQIDGAAIGGAAPTVECAAGRVSGSGGCNRYFGRYEADAGGALAIDVVGTTQMACDPQAMRQEAVFLEALDRASAYQRLGGTLVLSAPGSPSITFR